MPVELLRRPVKDILILPGFDLPGAGYLWRILRRGAVEPAWPVEPETEDPPGRTRLPGSAS